LTVLDVKRAVVAGLALVAILVGFLVPLPQSIKAPVRLEPAAVWSLTIEADLVSYGWEAGRRSGDAQRTVLQIERPDRLEVVLHSRLEEGELVLAGDSLAIVLSHGGVGSASMLKARIEQAAASVEALEAGAREVDLTVLEARLELAQTAFDAYQPEWERYRTLHDDGAATPLEWLAADGRYRLLQAEERVARAELDAARAGARAEDIALAREVVKVERSGLEAALATVGRLQLIRSPIAGRLRLAPGGNIVRIERFDTLLAVIELPEGAAYRIESGQAVELTLPSTGSGTWTAVALRIDHRRQTATDPLPTTAGPQSQHPLLVAEVPNSAGRLEPGMSGRAVIPLGRMTLAEMLRMLIGQRI